jgi:hypothetical protein
MRAGEGPVALAYSPKLGQWAARLSFCDLDLSHAIRVLLRHLRLSVSRTERREAQTPGAMARAAATIVRSFLGRRDPAPVEVESELSSILSRLLLALRTPEAAKCAERACFELMIGSWPVAAGSWRAPAGVVTAFPRTRPVGAERGSA